MPVTRIRFIRPMTAGLTDRTVRSKFRTRVRTLFISDVHLGTRTAQAERLLRFPQAVRGRHHLPGGRHHRFLESAARPPLGAVAQRRAAEADAPRAQGHPPRLHPRQPRRGPARLHRLAVRRHRDPPGHRAHDGAAGGAIWCCTATSSTSSCAPPSGWRSSATAATSSRLWLNNPLNWVRRHLGLGYWSLSAYLKYRVKSAVSFIGAFEEAVATEAARRGVDGVICGHIHHPADRMIADNALPQLRRLGRELHGHRRDARRPAARRAPPARSRPRRLTPAWPSLVMPEFRVSEISSARRQ